MTKDNTTIARRRGDPSEVKAQAQLQAEISRTDPTGTRKAAGASSWLAGGVCVIKVGAATEVELKEKKHRIEDAVSATARRSRRASLPAAALLLIHAAAALKGDLDLTGDEKLGVGIVRRSLAEPLRWIAENGGEQGYVVTSKVAELKPGNGFNAVTGVYGDLYADGVIDPVKVTRSALANAASIASLLLTTETLVVEKPEEEDAAPAGHGHSH